MKKLTLNETWTLCLRMWKWIARQAKKDRMIYVGDLKRQWLKKHGFGRKKVASRCFFCEYASKHNFSCTSFCENCPGKLISPSFYCENTSYGYVDKPIAFYNKLVSLNRKRKK